MDFLFLRGLEFIMDSSASHERTSNIRRSLGGQDEETITSSVIAFQFDSTKLSHPSTYLLIWLALC